MLKLMRWRPSILSLLGIGLLISCGDGAARPARASLHPNSEPLEFISRVLGGAAVEAELPMVVALHGRGSDPERFAQFFEGATAPARLVLVEAPIDEGNGRAWFGFQGGRQQLAERMRGLAQRVAATTRLALQRHATRGQPVVMGFSQGAMLVYILALEHPSVFRLGVPVSGVLFELLIPQAASHATPLVVLHGGNDPIISFSSGTRNLELLRSRGATVQLRRFPDAQHWIAGDMKTALHEILGIAGN